LTVGAQRCSNAAMIVRRRNTTRRDLLTAAGAVVLIGAPGAPARAERPALFSAIGITAGIDRAAELKALGAEFIVESAAEFLIPFSSDAAFAANKAKALTAPLPVRGCNSFLRDPALICVGPKADHPRVLAYAQTAFARLQQIGGEYIVFGSNSARRIPDGWSKTQADAQFIALLREMAPIAQRHGITVGVEMQQRKECNYLNFLEEVVNVVAPVDHPNIRVLADLFHMRVMGDTPRQLEQAMRWVGVVELAERAERTLPGVAGDDFRPYFTALARGGYRGLVDIEGDGTAGQLRNAFTTVAAQAREASL